MLDRNTPLPTLGADIRALRKSRGITLSALAAKLDRSVGWISQVERDISNPSFEDLQRIAAGLGVPLSLLFGEAEAPAEERGFVVRNHARRQIGASDGLTEALLSPDLTDDFEVVHSTFAPGAELAAPLSRPTQELAYLISGHLSFWINETQFDLAPGDSIRIRGEAYRWANRHAVPAIAIWVIAPPVY